MARVELGREYSSTESIIPSLRARFIDAVINRFSAIAKDGQQGSARIGLALMLAVAGIVGVAAPDATQLANAALSNLKNPAKSGKVGDPSRGTQVDNENATGISHRLYLPENARGALGMSNGGVIPREVPTPEVTPTPSLGPVTFNYDIGPGVATSDLELIRTGVNLAQNELQTHYGGDIRRPATNPLTVKVVATGLGNQEPGGNGGAATALDQSGARLFFDVRHPQWINMHGGTVARRAVAGHEYTHAWQNYLGCLTIHKQPLGNWLNEGLASYIPIQSLIRTGALNGQVERYFSYTSAKDTGEMSVPLESINSTSIWPGHVGYLAVEYLVSRAPSGALSLRTVCESVASGLSVDQAFTRAFGQSQSDLYRDFPSYLQSLRSSPVYLEQVRRLPQGSPSWAPADAASYEFNFVAYGYEDLTPDQQNAAWTLPPQVCTRGSQQTGKMIIALCNASSGTYPVAIQMPDGRKIETGLVHSN